jgi:hypothetical protein
VSKPQTPFFYWQRILKLETRCLYILKNTDVVVEGKYIEDCADTKPSRLIQDRLATSIKQLESIRKNLE